MVEKKKPSMSTMVLARWCLLGIITLFLVLMATHFLTGCGDTDNREPIEYVVLSVDVRGEEVHAGPPEDPRLPIFSIVTESSGAPAAIDRFHLILELHNGAEQPKHIWLKIVEQEYSYEINVDRETIYTGADGHYIMYAIHPPIASATLGQRVNITITEDGELHERGQIVYRILDFGCDSHNCDIALTEKSIKSARVTNHGH